MGSKFNFFHWKTYISQFSDQLLKSEGTEYLAHHVKLEIWPVLCKFPTLLSTVKLKFGHNLSQLIYRFKIGTFESWT